MAEICISVVSKLAEYTVAPVLRQFGYLINYKSNVQDLTQKVTTLAAKRDGVQRRVNAAKRNLEDILPLVDDWLERVKQTIEEKQTCFEEGRVASATTCCSSNGWCPNLKVRHSLSRKAAKMAPKVDVLLTEGDFGTISFPARAQKIDVPAMQYFEDSTQTPAKHQEGASSSSGTSNAAKPPAPMDLSERLKYRLPYTKNLLTSLQDDKISIIGITGTIRDIDTVTTKEFMKRMKHRNLFEEVMLDLKLENGSLVERAEWLRAVLLASDLKRILVILTDVWGILDLDAIGISHVDIKKSCKIMLISQLSNVFGEMETRSNFKLLLQSTPIARPVEFESRISVIRDVMDALTDDDSNPIVICGMGGIGKTTLAMEIGAKASEVDLFDHVAIAEFTQEPDLIKIQGKIAKALDLKLEAEDDRAAMLRERLSGGTKKVLLILDNVWKPLNLWELGIPIFRDPKCCKLLVSSRNQDIFKEMKTKKNFPIGSLSKRDAWCLFKKVAGSSIEFDLELHPIAKDVLDECGGLPVAISTVGGALQGKSISNWRDALRQLKQACPEDVPGVIKDVYGKIELSYEYLPSEKAKSCFLLCSLWPESEDFPTELLVLLGIGLQLFKGKGIDSIPEARDCIKALVDTLKDRSLLLDSDEKGSFKMHDVVRDVAVYIGSEELRQKKNDQLERRVVLRQGEELNHWRKNNVNKESIYCNSLTTNMSTTSTELLLLIAEDESKLELPATIFDGMEDLKVLFVGNSVLPSLPILKNLQALLLMSCHLNFDVIGELRTLMILNLAGSDIKQLPDTFKNLSNLRWLNLSECKKLKAISPGVLLSLSRLEELYMWDSFEDWVVEKLCSTETINWISQLEVDAQPEKVDIWKKLNRLAVEKLASTETTTDLISRLEDEERSEPEEVDNLGDLFAEYVEDLGGNYDHLTRWANSMDWRIGLLSELLSLSGLTALQVVLPPIDILRTSKLFHKLERFKINIGWGDHEDLEDIEGNYLRVHDLEANSLAHTGISLLLKKTKKLDLKMKNLTDPVNVLDVNCCAKLESLTLRDCDSVEYLIDMTVKQDTPPSVFPVLNYLEIDGARRLKEIFHGDLPLGSLQKLEWLLLQNLPALTTIWTIGSQSRWLGDLAAVHDISIRDCQSLEAIFALEGSGHHVKEINFLSLTRLILEGLPSFTGMSKSTCKGLEKQLEVGSLHPNSLTAEHSLLFDPKVVFPVLRSLKVKGLGNLKEIWNSRLSPNSFSELRELTVEDCDKLLHLGPTQMQNRLQRLETIRVKNCSSLEEIFEVGRSTVNEGNASISQSDKIPSNISQPDQGMQINEIMDFKQSCQGFQNLTKLDVSWCRSLRYLLTPSIARGLVKLKSLEIRSCEKIEAIVAADEGEETEDESNCQSLEAVFALEGSGHHVKEINFPSLTQLILEGLPSFTGMSRSTCKGMERQLEGSSLHPNSLTVEHSLFSDPKVVFPVLEDLTISRLGNLKEIWNSRLSPNSFSELRRLTVVGCDKLLHLVPTQMRNRLQRFEDISVVNCSSLEEIFEVGRLTVNEGNASISQSDKIDSNISQSDQGMQINDIMDFKQSCQGFQNLTDLYVSSCGSLRYLLSPSIARGLVKLESLAIRSCEMIKAIVAADEGEETGDESMLPQLSSLTLTDLPNLGSFSQGKYTFNWPLVEYIMIYDCIKMDNFCSGSLSISREVRIYVSDSGENLEQELNDSKKES